MSREKTEPIAAPPYADFSETEREALLSQLGNFTPYQRTIFHELCKSKQGEVPYKHFAERMSLQVKNVDSEIEGLVQKLNIHKMALLRFNYGPEGKDKKLRSIILSDQGDWTFYLHTFLQLLDDLYNSQTPRIPVTSVLDEEGIQFPDYMVTEIKRDQLRKPFIEKNFKDPAILTLVLEGDESIYIYSKGINQLIQLCIAVIKDVTQSNNVLSELARFKDMALTKLRENLNTRAPGIWLDITKSILEFEQQGPQKQLTITKNFFFAADIVFNYLKNEIEDAKQQKDQDRQVDNDLRTIEQKLKKKYFEPISQDSLNGELKTLKEKYGDRFEEVKEQFFNHYTKTKDRIKLPHIVFIGQRYIHRNHLHKYAAYEFKELGETLDDHYIALMRDLLRTNNRANTVVFHSMNNFNLDIEDRVKEQNTFVSELLQRPRLLAESIIHVAKEEQKVKEIDQVRHILELYFIPGTMRYRPLPEIFKLNIHDIYRRGYNLLPVLRQMWMKLTGKHRAFRDQFSQYRRKSGAGSASGGVAGGGQSSQGLGTPGTRRRGGASRRRSDIYIKTGGDTITALHQRRAAKPKPKPQYTKKQTDQAWDEFRDSLKK